MKLKNLFTVFSLALCTNAYSMDLEQLTDPSRMVDEICKELALKGRTDPHDNAYRNIDKQNLHTAAAVYARYYIVGQLDAACCYYSGTRNCFKRYTEEQPFSQTIIRRVSNEELNRIFREQYAWAEQKVEEDAMQHSLRYIEGYSFDSFGDVPRAIIIPQEQWKEKRKAVLEELKDEFNIQ